MKTKILKLNQFWLHPSDADQEKKYIEINPNSDEILPLKGRVSGSFILLDEWGIDGLLAEVDSWYKNTTNYILMLSNGYCTASGSCTDIYLFPKQSIKCVSKGDAISFAEYMID